MSKINLRIISKPHAHLQSMMTTSLKFQKNRNKTVGGVAHTRYIQYSYRGTKGRKDRRNDGKSKTMSLRFSSKRRGTIKHRHTLMCIRRGFKHFARYEVLNPHNDCLNGTLDKPLLKHLTFFSQRIKKVKRLM